MKTHLQKIDAVLRCNSVLLFARIVSLFDFIIVLVFSATKVDRASKSQSKTSNEPSTAASTVATRRSADSKATEKTLNDSSKSESSRAPTATNSGKQKAFNGLNQEVTTTTLTTVRPQSIPYHPPR